jgi:hypothetical protein
LQAATPVAPGWKMLDEAIEGAALVCNRLPTEHLQLLPKDRVTLQQGMTPSQDSEWAPGGFLMPREWLVLSALAVLLWCLRQSGVSSAPNSRSNEA